MSDLYQIPAYPNVARALIRLARLHGRQITLESLTHGLAVKGEIISATAHDEICKRAGYRLVPVAVRSLDKTHCPLLLAHSDRRIVIVTEFRPNGVVGGLADTGESTTLLAADLVRAGFNSIFSAVPLAHPATDANSNMSQNTKDDFGWFRDSLKLSWNALLPIMAATVVINLLALAVPLISMNIMDRVVSHAAFETLWALTVGGIATVLMDFMLRTLRVSMIDQAAARSDVLLSNQVFSRTIGARLVNQQTSVGIKSNSLREYESLREIYNSVTVTTLGDLPFAVLFFFVVWLIAGPLVLVLVVMAPLLLLTGYFSQWGLQKLSKEHFKDNAHKNALAIELLSGIETLKSSVGENWALARWEHVVANHLRHSLGMRWWTALGANLVQVQQSFTTIAILVVGVYLVVAKDISPGALFATIMLGGRALTPVMQLSALIAKLHHAKTAYQAIKQLADVEQDRPENVQFLACPAEVQPLILSDVQMTYGTDAPPALRNLSINIMPGEKIGIVGGIGSGKSTLLRLLLGLKSPTAGNITMANTPIQRIDPAQYRRLFGTSLQDAAFFTGTILENICFHRADATDAELSAALAMSGAMTWVSQLPSGTSTVIAEQGRNLSSGQRQTLVLARAFLCNPSALILDEPTSDLDGRSETQLVAKLCKLPATTTLIVVSHRPAVLEACQRLIVLDSGNVVLDGEKSVVLSRLRGVTRTPSLPLEAAS